MRYGIISDVHSNLEAFRAVLDALSKARIDEYLFIGDLVGYGADPHECIKEMKALGPKELIAGNHDRGMLGLLDIRYFNEYAAEALIWTKGVLGKEDLDYFGSFRLIYESDRFTLVHGSLEKPEDFNYIMDEDEAYRTMKLMKTAICFVGHSHAAGIFHSAGGRAAFAVRPNIKIEPGNKYIVNVGSIGQPRDGDSRAAYAIYDDKAAVIEIKRAAYDINAAQQKIRDAGLPEWLASRLAEGR